MNSGVYEIINTVNGHRYIGQTVKFSGRKNYHWWSLRRGTHSSPILQRAWNKYGEAAFKFQPLVMCAPVSEALTVLEQHFFDTLHPEYNIAPAAGSNAGHKYPPEFGAKVSAALRGKKKPPRTMEHKKKLGAAHAGTPMAAVCREALRDALTGRPKSRKTRAHMVEAQKIRRLADGTLRLLTFDGKTHTLSEWAALLGMDRKLLDLRLWRGWTPERAFTTPVNLKYLGKGKT